MIGRPLVTYLRGEGHAVSRLVRRDPVSADEVRWDPATGFVDVDGLGGPDAIIHLAGAGVGDSRWTAAYKREILDSRVLGTRAIARAAVSCGSNPLLISGSAIGFYGDTGTSVVDETGPNGRGFLADVVREWEAATGDAEAAGLTVTHARTGLVVSKSGGAWAKMWPLFSMGVGGRLGNGRQWWSFISLRDEVRALSFLLEARLAGPVNLTAPEPITNADATRATAAHLRRPAAIPVPAFGLRAVLGEFASEILVSQGVRPQRLMDAGFIWDDPTIDAALAAAEWGS